MMSLIVLTPKGTVLGRNYVIWAKKRENRLRGSSWALEREKKDRKKSQKGYISPIWGEAPTEAMYIKICVVGDALESRRNHVCQVCDAYWPHIQIA